MKDKTKLEDGKIAIITEPGFDQLKLFYLLYIPIYRLNIITNNII